MNETYRKAAKNCDVNPVLWELPDKKKKKKKNKKNKKNKKKKMKKRKKKKT